MAGWIGDQLCVSVPEVIALIDVERGVSVTNPEQLLWLCCQHRKHS